MALESRGMRINRTKTVQLNFGTDREQSVHLDGEEMRVVEKFKYLGSIVDGMGDLDNEITHRVNAGWMNWKRMTGVLCDKRMSLKIKGKIYKTVVRPAMLHGAETWAVKKVQEKRLEVAEMKMLRWSCGVTKLDRIRNEVIRGKIKVTELSKKVQERRLQWFGHVERRDESYIGDGLDMKREEMRVA
uniref:Endonuclease-reverse transcriptase n=1 Tax=Cacopsylla melanoneura TaxID=428564 RepID=A0A8D9FDT2_9HEMI